MSDGTQVPRVLHVVPLDAWGGVETAARSAAEAEWIDCDLHIMFLAGRSIANNRARIIDNPDLQLRSIRIYWRALKNIIEWRPSVVICSLWRSIIIGIIVKALRPKTNFVCFLHNTRSEHFVDRVVHAFAFHFADEIWADSASTLDSRLSRRDKPTRVISFVTERLPQVAPPQPAPRFVSWSRLHTQKGHDRAIRLIDVLVRRGVDATLDIWGADNGEGRKLQELVTSLDLDERVRFPGILPRSSLKAIAADYSFFLFLSRYEGMAMAVVEAMQLGLVPVVTPVGQISGYVQDNVNGILVNVDNLSAAADAIQAALESGEAYSRMSRDAAATWRDRQLYADDICKAVNEISHTVVHSVGGKSRHR